MQVMAGRMLLSVREIYDFPIRVEIAAYLLLVSLPVCYILMTQGKITIYYNKKVL